MIAAPRRDRWRVGLLLLALASGGAVVVYFWPPTGVTPVPEAPAPAEAPAGPTGSETAGPATPVAPTIWKATAVPPAEAS